jgi:hypothetical protein
MERMPDLSVLRVCYQSEIEQGRKLRDSALANLESRRKSWVTMCRTFAINHARRVGEVSINDVRAVFSLPVGFSVNTWGTILNCKELEPCGHVQARHKDAHARWVRIYKLKGEKCKVASYSLEK